MQMKVAVMGFVKYFRYGLQNSKKYIFCPICNLLSENENLKTNFSKIIPYNSLMGCSTFSNSRFQMGVTVMGFAEHLWYDRSEKLNLLWCCLRNGECHSLFFKSIWSIVTQVYKKLPTRDKPTVSFNKILP